MQRTKLKVMEDLMISRNPLNLLESPWQRSDLRCINETFAGSVGNLAARGLGAVFNTKGHRLRQAASNKEYRDQMRQHHADSPEALKNLEPEFQKQAVDDAQKVNHGRLSRLFFGDPSKRSGTQASAPEGSPTVTSHTPDASKAVSSTSTGATSGTSPHVRLVSEPSKQPPSATGTASKISTKQSSPAIIGSGGSLAAAYAKKHLTPQAKLVGQKLHRMHSVLKTLGKPEQKSPESIIPKPVMPSGPSPLQHLKSPATTSKVTPTLHTQASEPEKKQGAPIPKAPGPLPKHPTVFKPPVTTTGSTPSQPTVKARMVEPVRPKKLINTDTGASSSKESKGDSPVSRLGTLKNAYKILKKKKSLNPAQREAIVKEYTKARSFEHSRNDAAKAIRVARKANV